MSINLQSCVDFGNTLFEIYPEFITTRSLYIDFEGTGSDEYILSLFWPQLKKVDRFNFLWRGDKSRLITHQSINKILRNMNFNIKILNSVVVFSVGDENPEEKDRFSNVLSKSDLNFYPWVNLHYVLKNSRETRSFIRKTAWAKYYKDQSRIRSSLENLEYQFGKIRYPELRSASNIYGDGKEGMMEILTRENELYKSNLQITSDPYILEYCRYDVESMFFISRKSQKLLR